MEYVDGFLLTVPKDKLDAYVKLASEGGKMWIKHGALAFRETVQEDMTAHGMIAFPDIIKPKADELVVFSYIVFKSREHRDEVNAKVMQEMKPEEMGEMPFDFKRMAYGGFTTLVNL